MSVLPDTGSKLPADSDWAAVVCTAPMEAVDSALDVVGLHVGQLWFRMNSEDVLPLMIDEHSMIGDFVQPDSVPVVLAYMSTDVCGDDRFSPGVTDRTSLDRQNDLDSMGRYFGNACRLVEIVLWPVCLEECSEFGCTYVGLAGVSGYGRPKLLFEDADIASGL